MLWPLRVAHIYQRTPVATWTLIGINVGMYVLTLFVGWERMWPLVLHSDGFGPHQLVTSLFLHTGFLHLAFNVLFLWVYGRYVEDRMGPWRYVAIYLACGVAGDVLFLATGGGASVGASGAISGLMGFVLVGAPWAEVQMLFLWGPYGTFNRTIHVAAFWVVGFWLLFQVLSAVSGLGVLTRVAYTAHLGGCLAGAGLALWFKSPACKGTSWYLDPSPPGGGPEATKRLQHARGRADRESDGPRYEVAFESLERVSSRVAVIRLLMKEADMEPDAANERLERVEAGETQRFAFPDAETAIRVAREVRGLGVQATYDGPPEEQTPPPRTRVVRSPVPSEPLDVDFSKPPVPPQPQAGARDGKSRKGGDAKEDTARSPTIRLASGQTLEVEEDPDAPRGG